MKVKYFEDTNFTESYIQKTININGDSIKMDLNFESEDPNQQEIETTNNFLEKLPIFLSKNSTAIVNDSKNEENTVNEYIAHHLEEISKQDLAKLIDLNNNSKSNEEKLLENLKVKRIGIYPQNPEQFAVFDYSIGEELTQYLVVIYTDKNGNITDISMES